MSLQVSPGLRFCSDSSGETRLIQGELEWGHRLYMELNRSLQIGLLLYRRVYRAAQVVSRDGNALFEKYTRGLTRLIV